MADPAPPHAPDLDVAPFVNAMNNGWNAAMKLHFVRATPDEVVAEIAVAECHLQPHGIVHGGVHAGVIEAIASVGAGLSAAASGRHVVGLENHTSFIHAVREGTLRATARPITRGRRTQVWEATVVDETGRVAATGRVRLLCLEPDTEVAGRALAIKGS